MNIKVELRNQFRKSRESYAAQRGGQANEAIALHFKSILSKAQNSTWLGYRAYGLEADPAMAIDQNSKNIHWAYPRVEGKELKFYIPKTKTAWAMGDFGILEPVPEDSEYVDHTQVEGALVPGLAFDKKGTRLGSGKGFYDRALKNFKGLKIGVGFAVQLSSESLPSENHDISMNCIVTDVGITQVEKGLLK